MSRVSAVRTNQPQVSDVDRRRLRWASYVRIVHDTLLQPFNRFQYFNVLRSISGSDKVDTVIMTSWLGLSEFCAKQLKIMRSIFVNSAHFWSRFFHFKLISCIAVLPCFPHWYNSCAFLCCVHFCFFFTFLCCFILLLLHRNGLRWLWQPSVPN